jgi:hypothetical protein
MVDNIEINGGISDSQVLDRGNQLDVTGKAMQESQDTPLGFEATLKTKDVEIQRLKKSISSLQRKLSQKDLTLKWQRELYDSAAEIPDSEEPAQPEPVNSLPVKPSDKVRMADIELEERNRLWEEMGLLKTDSLLMFGGNRRTWRDTQADYANGRIGLDEYLQAKKSNKSEE